MSEKPSLDWLLHYGTKRHSGRYPWGSGEDPSQHGESHLKFLNEVNDLRAKGIGDTEISKRLGMTTTQLRNNITWANAEKDNYNRAQSQKMKEAGMSNVAIGQKLGVSEATVRNYLSTKTPAEKVKKLQLDNISEAIKSGVANTGYLDVGVGVERQLGVSRTKFNAMVNKLVEDEGYHLHEVHVPRLSDPTGSKYTTVKVLTKNPDVSDTRKNSDKIRPLDSWSEDGGLSLNKTYAPHMLPLNRIKIRYAEEGGADKDGLIELRPGVKDLDLGRSKYAQVRIGAEGNLYLKGMAAYSEEKHFPKGVDIIFNTNKKQGTPPEKVFKPTKEVGPEQAHDPSAIFGSSVVRQKGALNLVNEQGDWDKWSGTMSSQFLSKQSTTLIKERLDDTYNGLRHEFDEINNMTNPVVKKFLMDKYIEGLDSKAKNLKAKGIKGTKSHVLLPFPDMKPNEIFAPNFENGQRVVLVRHPHGGIFEIPELVVNNKNATALKMIGGQAPDAVGIHPSVAEKLSGADFDGDTALVIPQNGNIKTSRTLKELKNFDPKMYQVDHDTISPRAKQTQMGLVSNLITDMTIKGASESELARAVKHSMVVIDAEKHKLDYKQSARDNGINALVKKYQSHINPDTGKPSRGASTLISRSKRLVDNLKKEGKDITDPSYDPQKYSSGTAREQLYVKFINGIIDTKKEATAVSNSIPRPDYSKEAAKLYAPEIASLNIKLNTALLNAPKERQAQIMTSNLFYANFHKGMEPDQIKKLKSRSLAVARDKTGAKKSQIEITEREWEAIQARAISNTKLLQILDNANMDIVRKLAAPRELKLNTAKLTRAKALLDKGYTLAEIARSLGVSPDTIMNELGLRKMKGSTNND